MEQLSMSKSFSLPPELAEGAVWSMPYFPARFQFVIFRNWNRVPVENIASVLKTSVEQIFMEAERLGLRKYNAESCRMWMERGYLTIIRNNWFILNYAQLLELLGIPEERLYRILMDEDFMYHKMGDQKPFCPEVFWRELEPEELAVTENIRQQTATLTALKPPEKEFDFLSVLEQKTSPCAVLTGDNGENLRLIYSYCAPFGDVLMPGAADPFPEGLLAQYQKSRINAVWMPLLLSDLVPWTGDEDYSAGYQQRQATLKAMVAKLARYNIKLFGYLNEPRALPGNIAQRHPEWCGPAHADGSGARALCINNSEVAAALRNGVADLCRAVPEIGGFFTITMSENLTHCFSRNQQAACPVCSKMPNPAANIIAVNSAIWRGIQDAKSPARLIAWNWAWKAPWDLEVLEGLPLGIELMCVSETDLVTDCRGIKGKIFDYSLAHPGPGAMALRMWETARKQGRRVIAKVQLNATWELSSLPYVPVPQLAKEHLDNLAKEGIENFMLSWTLGGAAGGNLPLAECSVKEWCSNISTEYAGKIEEACRCFCRGFSQFPFNSTSLIYCGPQNFGCANLLYRQGSGRRATMVGFCFDRLGSWSGGYHYPPQVLSDVFMDMAAEWEKGLKILQELRKNIAGNAAFDELCNMAEAAYCILQSSANQITFYHWRDQNFPWSRLAPLVESEKLLALRMLKVQQQDSRIGFEASNHYMYGENELLEKYLQCSYMLNAE